MVVVKKRVQLLATLDQISLGVHFGFKVNWFDVFLKGGEEKRRENLS